MRIICAIACLVSSGCVHQEDLGPQTNNVMIGKYEPAKAVKMPASRLVLQSRVDGKLSLSAPCIFVETHMGMRIALAFAADSAVNGMEGFSVFEKRFQDGDIVAFGGGYTGIPTPVSCPGSEYFLVTGVANQ